MSQCAKLKGNWDMWLWESKDNLLCFSRGQMWQGRALFNRETSQCNDFSKHLNVWKKDGQVYYVIHELKHYLQKL